MRLLIKQRIFSWTDSYDVFDENENVKYFVKAEFLSLGHRLHVSDAVGNELGVIREKLMVMLPTFEIDIHERTYGRIRKKLSLLRPKYEIDFNGWYIEGDFMGWNYSVSEGSSHIAGIKKELWHWGDTYVIDIANPEDELMALMLVIAIDAANCSN